MPLGPFSARARLLAGFLLALALSSALPALAHGSRPALTVQYPADPVAGSMLRVAFRAPRALPRTVTARLELRRGRRWVVVARGRVRRGRARTLRFTAPANASSIVLRLRLLRRGAVLATSRTTRLRLRRPVSAPPGRVQPKPSAPGGGTGGPPTGGPGTLQLNGAATTVVAGSVATLELPAPLEAVASLRLVGASAGMSVVRQGSGFALAADSDAAAGQRTLELSGVGCVAGDCAVPFALTLPVMVRALAAPPGPLDGFTSPSPARLAAGTPIDAEAVELRDQLNVTLGTPDAVGTRADADAAAAAVGGVVSGGLEALGVYEIRWTIPQDLDAREAELSALPGVTAVARAAPGMAKANALPPGDWSDDGPQATWPFTQVRAQQAWDAATGTAVRVGIVDGGLVYGKHEDLDVVQSIGGGDAADHATHVAGLACAKANGIGLVGMAWGCPVVTAGVGDRSATSVLEAATKVAWSGVRVVNLSLGFQKGAFCHSAAQQGELIARAQRDRAAFRQLFQGPVGRHVVWTIAAGNNCAEGVASPWGLNADLPNVITVAATNDDRSLASFSNFGPGVELAAPGGVSAGVGLWSTWVQACGPLGLFTCGSYATEAGTSMSAPVVAGIAALVRDAHPAFGAAEAAACLEQTAGDAVGWAETRSPNPSSRHPVVPFTPAEDRLPIADAELAVACATFDSGAASSYVGSWIGGAWVLDLAEELDGVLGAVNQSPTAFVNGCVAEPGLKLMTGMTWDGSGQWNGQVVSALDGACSGFLYEAPSALRAVRVDDGRISLVLAWPQDSSGTLPTIDVDGNVTSATPFWSLWLTRP